MGWINRLACRQLVLAQAITLRRIRLADAAVNQYEIAGIWKLAAAWRGERQILEQRFRSCDAAIAERLDREETAS